MTNTAVAYREIVSKHKTFAYTSPIGRVAARKVRGEYIVTVENFETRTVNRMVFKTMRGCMIAFDEARGLV